MKYLNDHLTEVVALSVIVAVSIVTLYVFVYAEVNARPIDGIVQTLLAFVTGSSLQLLGMRQAGQAVISASEKTATGIQNATNGKNGVSSS